LFPWNVNLAGLLNVIGQFDTDVSIIVNYDEDQGYHGMTVEH
jgi:predicted dinucleotide-utilizing enzyme